MTAAAEPRVRHEEWLYVGRRIAGRDKLVYAWQRPNGQMAYSKKLAANAIGGRYRISVGVDDNKVYCSGSLAPVYLDLEGDPDQVQRWELDDRQARTAYHAERMAAKLQPELDEALAIIRDRYQRTKPSDQRAALLALVIQRITG